MKFHNTVERDYSLQWAVQDFFDEVSLRTSVRQVCPLCGKEMEYLESTFRWFGTDSTWEVRLPICRCELNRQ